MFLSIIVPVYKVEDYLCECIDSILNQTFIDFELILVDDGSPDNCPTICDEYEKKDSRIKVFHKPNGGLMSAWKYGVERACGEWVGFVDSDDWIDQSMYDKMISVATETGVDMVCSALVCEYSNGKRSFEKIKLDPGLYDRKKIEDDIFPYLLISKKFHSRGLSPNRVTKIFRRDKLVSILDDCDEKVSIGEDVVTTFAYIQKADSVFLIDNYCPYHYRINVESMTQVFSKEKYKKIENLKDALLAINSKTGIYDFSVQIHTDFIDLYLRTLENEILTTKNKHIVKSINKSFHNETIQLSLKKCDKAMLSKKDRLYLFLLKMKMIRTLISIRRLKK